VEKSKLTLEYNEAVGAGILGDFMSFPVTDPSLA
jgi:hypothetical protein